jgi:hypothetical protein
MIPNKPLTSALLSYILPKQVPAPEAPRLGGTGLPAASPTQDLGASLANPETMQTLHMAAQTLLDVPEDQRQAMYPKIVAYIGNKSPAVANILAKSPIPSTEDLMNFTGKQSPAPAPSEAPDNPTVNVMRKLTGALPADAPPQDITAAPRADNAAPPAPENSALGTNGVAEGGILDAYTAPLGAAVNAIASAISPDADAKSLERYKQEQIIKQEAKNNAGGGNYANQFEKSLGAADAKRVTAFREEAQKAMESLAALDRASQVMHENPDAFGPFSDQLKIAREVGAFFDKRFGTNMADKKALAAQEQMSDITLGPVLDEVQKLKPASNTDVDMIKKAYANANNVIEANDAIIFSRQQLAKWKLKRASFYNQWIADHPNQGLKGADEAWADWTKTVKLQLVRRSPVDSWLHDAKQANPGHSDLELLQAAKDQGLDISNYKSPFEVQ